MLKRLSFNQMLQERDRRLIIAPTTPSTASSGSSTKPRRNEYPILQPLPLPTRVPLESVSTDLESISRKVATKEKLSTTQIMSLIEGQLSITPQLLTLSQFSCIRDKHIEQLASQRASSELQIIDLTGTSVTMKSLMALGDSRYVGRVRFNSRESEITVLIYNTPAAQENRTKEPPKGNPLYKLVRKDFSIKDPISGEKVKGKKILKIFG